MIQWNGNNALAITLSAAVKVDVAVIYQFNGKEHSYHTSFNTAAQHEISIDDDAQFTITNFIMHNTDATTPVTVSVFKKVLQGGSDVDYQIYKCLLSAGHTAQWNANGWTVYDEDGTPIMSTKAA